MRTVLVTGATFSPLDLETIKARPELRITTADDDGTLEQMLLSAIEEYEEYTQNVLCYSTWDLYLDEFPDEIETPGPLQEHTSDSPPVDSVSITYLDAVGVSQTAAVTLYKIDATMPIYGLITLAYGQSWPSTYDERNAIRVRFAAGYTDAASIPQRIKDGLILKVQELYDGVDRRDQYEACWARYRRWPV